MWSQELFLAAWNFAAEAHVGQLLNRIAMAGDEEIAEAVGEDAAPLD